MQTPPSDPMIGRYVGRYRITRRLGHGGMGSVYEVVQNAIGHRAAIKVLNSKLSTDPKHDKYVQRFLDEARAVNLINHPGVIQIYDFGELDDQTVYILMEYLDGNDLAHYLRGFRQGAVKRLSVFQAMQIARQLASALAVAHEKGVLHRDIKPNNVFLIKDSATPGGSRVKLLDFGVALFLDTPERRTTAGTAMGTPHYMSPEQCMGEENLDGKADVYSLGAMLYEVLAGDPPFIGVMSEVMRKHIKEPPRPLNEVTQGVPAAVIQLVHRMLEKKGAARPSMRELEERIEALEQSGELVARERAFLPGTSEAASALAKTLPVSPPAAVSAAASPLPPTPAAAPSLPAVLAPAPALAPALPSQRRPSLAWLLGLLGGGVTAGLLVGAVTLRRAEPPARPCPPLSCPAPACPEPVTCPAVAAPDAAAATSPAAGTEASDAKREDERSEKSKGKRKH